MWLPACSCVAESSSQRQTAVTNIVGDCGAMALPQTGSAFLQHNYRTVRLRYLSSYYNYNYQYYYYYYYKMHKGRGTYDTTFC
jgi:hypothetical protein